MRFRDGMKGVTPILSAIPTESTMSRPNGALLGGAFIDTAFATGRVLTLEQAIAYALEDSYE
jgi:hypothetical protein